MNDLMINEQLTVPLHELEFSYSRSSGPGGQHVNKTSTRVSLRWNVLASQTLTEDQRSILLQRLAPHVTHDGYFIIHVDTTRSQHKNKEIAIERFIDDIKSAFIVPKKRKKTKVSKEAQEKRLHAKKRQSQRKESRKIIFD